MVIMLLQDSKQPAGCFSLRWTQECNLREEGWMEQNGTELDTLKFLAPTGAQEEGMMDLYLSACLSVRVLY